MGGGESNKQKATHDFCMYLGCSEQTKIVFSHFEYQSCEHLPSFFSFFLSYQSMYFFLLSTVTEMN